MRKLRQTRRTVDPALPELRRRTAWLLRDVDEKTRAFVRLLPLLMTAKLRRPSFAHEPPGIKFAPRRRRWGRLCEKLQLPPPLAYSSGRALVQSIVLAPRADGRLDALVLPIDELTPPEVERLLARIAAITSVAQHHAPSIEVRITSRAELAPALLPWAAVCAGDMPDFADGLADRLDVVMRAPTPLARCLTLLIGNDAPSPLSTLRTEHGPARPESFLARWSGHPLIRALTAGPPTSLLELKEAGLALRRACIAALRRMPLTERKPLHQLFRGDLLSSNIPRVFRRELEQLVHGKSAHEKRVADGWSMVVDGVELAHGATLDQLRAAAVAETPLLARPNTPWERVASLKTTPSRRLVVVEAGFVKHLVVSLSPSGRPRARRVDAAGLLRFVLTARVRGSTCELMTSIGSDQALVMRAAQVSALPMNGSLVGLQVGERLLLADRHTVRSRPLKAALSRPRQVTWAPVDHELGRALRPAYGTLVPTVHAVAWPLGDNRSAIYFVDQHGYSMREEVARSALEGHLIEARQLLQHAPQASIMSVTVHPMLAALAGRRLEADLPVVPLEVECEWPFTVRVWLEGEAFGGPTDLSWSALAESILSRWSPGTWGRVGVSRVSYIRPPDAHSPLSVLAVRSRVLRRVTLGLRRLTRVLEAA